MKISKLILLTLIPFSVFAQNPMEMSEADMKKAAKMMQQAQLAMACMEKVDQSPMMVLEQRGGQFEAEMQALCASGNRGAAQKKAVAFNEEMSKNAEVQAMIKAMKKCNEMMKEMVPDMPLMDLDFSVSDTAGHVCDEVNSGSEILRAY